jgi:hypothetical protein
VSSESIASPPPLTSAGVPCATCGAPLAPDQRYCLECGERSAPMSSVLLGGPPLASASGPNAAQSASPGPPSLGPPAPPGQAPSGGAAGSGPRGNAVTVIAGVGVLLLAMGVGVLIGRSGSGSKGTAGPSVISVANAPSAATGTSASSEAASFSDDWPAGTSGYTVQLQTLPQAGTQTSAVEAAKAAATAKRAKQVGALKAEDFSSLKAGPYAGDYVIYSGVYHKKPEANSALAKLRKSFPSASVIKVSSGGAAASTGSSGGGHAAATPGSSESHPAPPKVIENLRKPKSGKSYEQESKNLPDVVETG